MVVELVFPPVFAFMRRRMRFWKRAENASARVPSSTAIRELIARVRETRLHAYWTGPRCPCLTCTVKIAQVGISEVVYSQGYNMDKDVCKLQSDILLC